MPLATPSRAIDEQSGAVEVALEDGVKLRAIDHLPLGTPLASRNPAHHNA